MRRSSRLSLYVAVALVVGGFVLIFFAWDGAAEKDFVQGQFPYLLSGGLGGLGLILCGLALALAQSFRRDMLSLQDRLEALLGHRPPGPAASAPATTPGPLTAMAAPTGFSGTGGLVATSATYHRASCRTVGGRADLEPVDGHEAVARGLAACRVCRPQALIA